MRETNFYTVLIKSFPFSLFSSMINDGAIWVISANANTTSIGNQLDIYGSESVSSGMCNVFVWLEIRLKIHIKIVSLTRISHIQIYKVFPVS